MAYVQTEWVAGVTPLSEANMDHLETQYDEAVADLIAKALLTTRGDIIRRGAAIEERLAKGTTGQVLMMDANDPYWATIVQGTKEFFIPIPQSTIGGGALGEEGSYPTIFLGDATDRADLPFYVPDDWTAITEAVIVVVPKATEAAANWDIASDYAAAGQAVSTHTESDAATTYNVVANQIFEVDISGILTGIAVGDYVGVRLTLSDATHDVAVVGLRFKYS